ncbi:MAG: glycoside hydrolase family 130 protein [Opitutaceae bacterium]|nr:glycoside hydrolase family 130 protein [Opitutaceae bacterium]MBP9913781.1 glycoside hydrolase family 130 protein [Opitutaceae bacterium]
MQRHPANPLLTHRDCPFPATTVFNAGVARVAGRYVMMFRNDHGRWGDARFDGTNLGLATSADGIKWTVQPRPVLDEEGARAGLRHLYPARFGPEFIRRVYDPRITVIEGRIVLCLAVDTAHGICGVIATTEDFAKFTFISMTTPDNRNMVLLPERIGGEFVRLERPFPVYMRAQPEAFPLWLSRSADLCYWGKNAPVLGPDDVPYVNNKIGPAAPPVRTRAGWLTPIHAVWKDETKRLCGWEERGWFKTYYAGLMLLDLADPTRVLGLMRTPLLAPEAPYEIEGFRGSVIFPCGMLLDETSGEVRLYYGAADTCIALASAHVDDLIAACQPL